MTKHVAIVAETPADAQTTSVIAAEQAAGRNRRTIQGLVDGYATQDIDAIMALFANDAVYCDILGNSVRGDEYHGKAAIRHAVARQFDLSGRHTYVDAKIMVEGDVAFASWTLVLGDPANPKAARFEGIDEFAFNANGQVTLKKAWLKGQPRLRRKLLTHNPAALFRHLGYLLKSLRS
jgi:ketosteroid isomerase-like protein